MAEVPDVPQDGWADNLSPDVFVSQAQQQLRAEFDSLTLQNDERLRSFEPEDAGTPLEELPFWTSLTEFEQAEPTLTLHYCETMLKKLDLNFRMLEPGDPNLVMQLTHDDDTLTQIRYVNREDGVRVPLMSLLDEEGLLTNLYMLSNEGAQKNVDRFQPQIDENRKRAAIVGLSVELKIDDDEMNTFYEGADKLGLEELLAMLEDAQNQTPEVIEGDNDFSEQINGIDEAYRRKHAETEEAISEARKSYAKAAMPTLRVLDRSMRRKVGMYRQRYQQLVEENLRQLEYVGPHAAMEMDREQGRRHAALNEQLRKRKMFTKIGAAAITGAVDLFDIAATTAFGHFLHVDGVTAEKGLGASVAAAAVFSVVRFFTVRNRLNYAVPFDSQSTAQASEPLNEQLESEKTHARHTKRIFRSANKL